MSFNGHFIFIIVVLTTFINFINSFRFDTSHNSHKFKFFALYIFLKNSLIIHEENTKKNHKRVVSLYVIKNHVNLHKL